MSEYIAADIISRRTGAGESLEKIVKSVSEEDIYRYYLAKPLLGGAARVEDLTALGRIEGHTTGQNIEGSTIIVEQVKLDKMKTILDERNLLGKVRVIGVEGKWGRSSLSDKKLAKGGSNELRTNVFAHLSGFQEMKLTDLGDNIYSFKPADLPDITLQTVKKAEIVPLLSGDDIMRIKDISPGQEVGRYHGLIKELQQKGLIKTKEEAEDILRSMD